MLLAQIQREWRLVVRSRSEALNPLVFLTLSVTLFALALDGSAETLRAHAAGVFWVLALLSSLLSLDGMFRRDFSDGTLEQLLLVAEVPFLAILGKILVQWLVTGFAVVLVSPVLGTLLQLPAAVLPDLALVLLIGTPTVSALGAIGAALVVGVRQGGALLGLLLLPLYIPVLIFGTAAVNGLADGAGLAQAYWLGAMSVISMTLAPFAVHAGLKASLDS